jgi:hypothetical protein
LDKEIGEHIAEQRGWHWAMTSFARDNWTEQVEWGSQEIDLVIVPFSQETLTNNLLFL